MARTIQPTDVPIFDEVETQTVSTETKQEPKKLQKTVLDPGEPEFDLEDKQPENKPKKVNYLEEDNQEEEQEEVEDKEQTPQNPEDIEEIKGLYSKMQEMGVFIGLPEDFEFDGTPEKLEEAFKFDQETRNKLAYNQVVGKIQDPLLQEAIDYGMKGGQFADFASYLDAQRDFANVETLEVKSEDQAKELVIRKLKAQGIKEQKIIDLYLEDIQDTKGSFMDSGKEAADYFKAEAKNQKDQLKQAAVAEAQNQNKINAEYEKKFMDNLKNSGLNERAQERVVAMFDPVTLKNGQTYSKHELIKYQVEENPAHFIQLLDFLNTYNPEKGFDISKFKAAGKTEQTKKVYDILKSSGSKTKTRSFTQYQGNNSQSTRNPVDRNITVS